MNEIIIDSLQPRFIWERRRGGEGLYSLVFDQMVALCQQKLSQVFLNSTVVVNSSSTQRQFIVCCVLSYPFQSHPTTGSHVALWVGMYRVMKLVY